MPTRKAEMFKDAYGTTISGGTYNNVGQGIWNISDPAADQELIKKAQVAFAAAAASGPATVATMFEGFSGTIQGQQTYNNSAGGVFNIVPSLTKATSATTKKDDEAIGVENNQA